MINWNSLKTCGGNAKHIPEAIENVFSENLKIQETAYWQIDNHVVCQGVLYEASYYVIDQIINKLNQVYTFDRYFALEILVEIALGDNSFEHIKIVKYKEYEILTIVNACRDKLINFLPNIHLIEVRTEKEIEEKNLLIETICGYSFAD